MVGKGEKLNLPHFIPSPFFTPTKKWRITFPLPFHPTKHSVSVVPFTK